MFDSCILTRQTGLRAVYPLVDSNISLGLAIMLYLSCYQKSGDRDL